MPQISVIVPVYNTEQYLPRCVDSILAQTFTDFELLLIDDGSKDSSGKICDEYAAKDSRVKVFHKENGGVSSARNLGLDNALGAWITFCDSDDWVYSDWLIEFIHGTLDSELICQGIRFDYSLSNQDKSHIHDAGITFKEKTSSAIIKLKSHDLLGYLVNKCFKKQLIDDNKIKFDIKFNFHEDEEFILRYLKVCNNIASTNNISYYYITPDFEKKYTITKNGFDLYFSLYSNSLAIVNAPNPVSNFYLYHLTEYFIKEIKIKPLKKKVIFMKSFRKSIGKGILSTPLFAFSKWVILLDITGWISTITLITHLSIKEKLLHDKDINHSAYI